MIYEAACAPTSESRSESLRRVGQECCEIRGELRSAPVGGLAKVEWLTEHPALR
jgi:hypothetical protein